LLFLLTIIFLPLKTSFWKLYFLLGFLFILGLIIYRGPQKMWTRLRGPILFFLSFLIFLVPLTIIFSPEPTRKTTFYLEQIAIRMALLVMAEAAFILSYQVEDLLAALNQCHLPDSVIQLLTSAIRYSQLLTAEAVSSFRARQVREVKKRGPMEKLNLTGLIIEKLFLRTLERSEKIYAAMLSRGYEGKLFFQKSFRLKRLTGLLF
jgi:ABC-type cobalt transport system, permease component CbiQ and related transporters